MSILEEKIINLFFMKVSCSVCRRLIDKTRSIFDKFLLMPSLVLWLLISSYSCNNDNRQIAFFNEHVDTLSLGSIHSLIVLDSCVVRLGDRSLISFKERNNLYYLLDIQSKRLFSFDKNGNTRYCIDRVGRGPGEYLRILDFDVSKDGSVYLLTGEGDEVMLFSEGRFMKKFKISFLASSMAFMHDNNIAFFKQRYEDDNLGKNVIIITDSQFNVKHSFLEESNTILTGSGEHLAFGSGNSILCYQQYDNNLYWFDRDGLLSRQTIDFGEKVFPESFSAIEDFGEMFSLLSEISAYYINSCYENKHYILLNITLCDHMNENNRFICLYHKNDQKSFVKRVERDSEEYEIRGIPIHLTQDDKMVFLYDIDKISSSLFNDQIEDSIKNKTAKYALIFQSIR